MSDEPKKVGYGVTPEHTRIKPGQKLPGAGRPKGSPNKKTLAQLFLKQADATIEVTEKGVTSHQRVIDVVIKRLRKLALTGDDGKMLKYFLDSYEKNEKIAATVSQNHYPFSEMDKQVMDEMYRRMKLCAGAAND